MNSKERKQLQSVMLDQFGSFIQGSFMINKRGKVYLVSPKIALVNLGQLNAEGVGLYIGTWEDDGFRPSIEGAQLLKAKKNVIQVKDWFDWTRGFKLEVKSQSKGYVLIKHDQDLLGCGKSNGESIINYVPKARRIKQLMPR